MAKVKPSAQEIAATKSTFISLAVEAAQLAQKLNECGGEITPELEAQLDVNAQSLLAKADNYNFIIEQFEANAAIWKRRKDACASMEKSFNTQIDKLWERIKLVMKTLGTDEVSGNLCRFKLSRSAPKLVIEDESKIPAEYKIIVQTTAVDKERIKEALAAGFEIPGARIEENGTLRAHDTAVKE